LVICQLAGANQGAAVTERLFLDGALRQQFGAALTSFPRMRRPDVEDLLAGDTHRRIARARIAAIEWGNSEHVGKPEIISEHMLITPHGLLYAAVLSPQSQPHLYYLATSRAQFEPIAGAVEVTQLPGGSVAAVDRRYGHDLEFPWPLDAALRRMLDAHEVLRMEPAHHDISP
jgi:hypothetical protein